MGVISKVRKKKKKKGIGEKDSLREKSVEGGRKRRKRWKITENCSRKAQYKAGKVQINCRIKSVENSLVERQANSVQTARTDSRVRQQNIVPDKVKVKLKKKTLNLERLQKKKGRKKKEKKQTTTKHYFQMTTKMESKKFTETKIR